VVNETHESKGNYKLIYQSNIKSVSGFNNQQQQRTESFHDNLEEFKKEQKDMMSAKDVKKLSTTQKLFSRKGGDNMMFGKKVNPLKRSIINNNGVIHVVNNPRLTKNQIDHLQKDDLQQLRKIELQQKAKERKLKLDQDNYLKINRDQMINNVCQIIFKHIEAAEAYIEVPTQAARLFHEHNFMGHEWNI
jgi:hypothetical protein